MDFFAHQEAARKRSGQLVALLCLCVLTIAGMIYIVIVLGQSMNQSAEGPIDWWQPWMLLASLAGTICVVSSGSAWKIKWLSCGGAVVAEGLGGRRLHRDATELKERELLNIVDEMAIAAGIPVPPVYLLEHEDAINAFAAGNSPSDAVVGVTAGCLEQLNRDELQAVIAHEFSHILNGDMRLNLRLIGILHGILLIGLAGRILMRTGGGSRSRSRRNDKGAGAVVIAGLALFIIGYSGLFFARLLQAAVSREREYLADASAVQFTRNPSGIAGALRRIKAVSSGSTIRSDAASEAAHLFFGSALRKSALNFATHPPLKERIRRIENAPLSVVDEERPTGTGITAGFSEPQLHSGLTGSAPAAEISSGSDWGNTEQFAATSAMASAGGISPTAYASAQRIRQQIPQQLNELTRSAYGARAVVYGLLLDREPAVCTHQLLFLQDGDDKAVAAEVTKIAGLCHDAPVDARIPLVELSLTALRDLSSSQQQTFLQNIDALIHADNHVHLFEYLLRRLIVHHLQGDTEKKRSRQRKADVEAAATDLVVTLAQIGAVEETEARDAAQRSLEQAGLLTAVMDGRPATRQTRNSEGKKSLKHVDRSLDFLSRSTLDARQRVLNACLLCVEHDGVTTADELQVVRVIASVLGCPLPLA